MANRWLTYALIGLCFGIVDWYFLEGLAALTQHQMINETLLQAPEAARSLVIMVLVSLNYGIWLVPVIPAAIYEMKHAHRIRSAAFSAILIWTMALVGYYAYYAIQLMFVGLPNLGFMLFANRSAATYWVDWWPPFKRIIVDQLIEWLGVAVVGGAIVGAASATWVKFTTSRTVQSKI
jgi:hypothetical protein